MVKNEIVPPKINCLAVDPRLLEQKSGYNKFDVAETSFDSLMRLVFFRGIFALVCSELLFIFSVEYYSKLDCHGHKKAVENLWVPLYTHLLLANGIFSFY